MANVMQVFLGGIIGSVLRYFIQLYIDTSTMLWIVNITGSFLLGSLNGHFEKKESKIRLLLTTGMLGAFTTFSTFTENWFIAMHDDFGKGLVYGAFMTIGSFIAAFAGYVWNRGERKWNG